MNGWTALAIVTVTMVVLAAAWCWVSYRRAARHAAWQRVQRDQIARDAERAIRGHTQQTLRNISRITRESFRR